MTGARAPLARLRAGLAGAIDALLAATLAPACVACGSILDSPVGGPACPSCWERLSRLPPPLCRRCGHPVPTSSAEPSEIARVEEACSLCATWPDHHLSTMRALGPYDGVLEQLVHALKYGGRRSLADRLGALLREAAADVLSGADAVVPVPLHVTRQWQRGFNQADLLARALGLPVWRLLHRVRATPPQAGLSAAARRRNLAGAFRPRRRPVVGYQATGRRLVLVDDVSTTGETLLACAAVLREAGADDVRAAVVARTLLEHGATSAPPPVSRARVAR